MSRLQKRLLGALTGYACLGLFGFFFLEGMMRSVLWLFLGGLAVKTLIAYKLKQQE